ncbi:MAG: DUF1566 domain-containing protein, partial [Planctomycetota bacterium]
MLCYDSCRLNVLRCAIPAMALILVACGGGSGGGDPTDPYITTHPQDRTVDDGSEVTFSVEVSSDSTTPLSYQWQEHGNADWDNIDGADSSDLALGTVGLDDDGRRFRVQVSNEEGTEASDSAQLTVEEAAPTIHQHPQSQSPTSGDDVVMEVDASGTAPITYQWQLSHDQGESWTNVTDATSPSYTIIAIDAAAVGDRYRVRVSNDIDAVVSDAAVIEAVTPATPDVTWPSVEEAIIYGDASDTATLIDGSAEVNGSSVEGDFIVVESEMFSVGEHDILIRFDPEDPDNVASVEHTIILAVDPRPLTVSGLEAEDKEYDGTDAAVVTGDPVLEEALEGDDVSLSGTLDARFASPAVGDERDIVLDGLELTGADSDSYVITSAPDLVAAITARPLGVEDELSASDREYDGSTVIALENDALSGVIDGDTVMLSATVASPDVAADREVTLVLEGEHADNYFLDDAPDLSASITPKWVEITPDSGQSKFYGDPDPELTYTANGLIDGDELSGSLSYAGQGSAGWWLITLGTLDAGPNYRLQLNRDAVQFSIVAQVAQTGQDESLRLGDDGDLRAGVVWPDPRFTDHGDDTVTDHLTGLMWAQKPTDFGTSNGEATWADAVDQMQDLELAGYDDWRL